MPIWEFRRLRTTALILLMLAAGVLTLDVLVSTAVGWNPLGGGQESQTYSRLEMASRKAAALARDMRHGQRVGVVVGMSTTEYGIDLRALDELEHGLKWAKVIGEHATFLNMLAVAERMAREGLKPERALVCVHYGMFVGAQRPPTSRAEVWGRIVSRADDLNIYGEILRVWTLTWLGKNRTTGVNAFEMQLGTTRERVLGAAGQDSLVIYDPIDAFEDVPNTRTARTREAWEGRMKVIFRRGWNKAEAYSPATADARAFARVLPLLGPTVAIVLLPERSVLRDIIPEPEARHVLRQAIETARLSRQPPIIDLRAALPDSEFVDEAHPTGDGRRRLSAALVQALAKLPH